MSGRKADVISNYDIGQYPRGFCCAAVRERAGFDECNVFDLSRRSFGLKKEQAAIAQRAILGSSDGNPSARVHSSVAVSLISRTVDHAKPISPSKQPPSTGEALHQSKKASVKPRTSASKPRSSNSGKKAEPMTGNLLTKIGKTKLGLMCRGRGGRRSPYQKRTNEVLFTVGDPPGFASFIAGQALVTEGLCGCWVVVIYNRLGGAAIHM